MCEFEDIRGYLHIQAGVYQGKMFEHWELINAVWVTGKLQEL